MTYRRCICHPDDLPGVGISSGWVTANSLCHPDDILFHFMSSGWLNWGWFLIRMSYGNVIMSSGWDTLPFLSHPDEIANFDFPQHAVALQRFRNLEFISTENTIVSRIRVYIAVHPGSLPKDMIDSHFCIVFIELIEARWRRYRLLSTRLQYIQCVSNVGTAVLH